MAKYQTPSEAGQKQIIDEELGIQDVTSIDEAWYPPTESEVASVELLVNKPLLNVAGDRLECIF